MKRIALFMALAIMLLSAGYLLAQISSLDEALTCDPTDLILAQLEAHESLAGFAPDLADDPEVALALLYEVGVLYQEWALNCGHIPENIGTLTVGDDVERIVRVLESVRGDPLSGQLLYNNGDTAADGRTLGCVGCHALEDSTGPLTAGTWTRWDEIRRFDPALAGYTFEMYMVESIVRPWDYHVPGYAEQIMPDNYGERLNYQNLADIIAYLASQDQFISSGD